MAMKGLVAAVAVLLLAPGVSAGTLGIAEMLRFIGFEPEAEVAIEEAAVADAALVDPVALAYAVPDVPVLVDATPGVPLPSFACEQHGLEISIQEASRHLTGMILVWDWDFGDGTRLTALTRSDNPDRHLYAQPGTYVVTLSVMDHLGITAQTSQVCAGGGVEAAPAPAEAAPPPVPAAVASPPEPRVRTCAYALAADGSCPASAPAPSTVPAAAPPPAPTARPAPTFVPAALPVPEPRAQAPAPVAIGAAAIVAIGGGVALWPLLRRLLPLALFTRLKDDQLLDHPVRNQIVQLVEAQPGIHYQAIARTLERGNGVLEHHLRMLTAAGLVRERAGTGYTCYFPAAMDRRLMDMHVVLKSDVARNVLDQIVRFPGRAISHVAEAVGVTPKAVTYHLGRFQAAGLVSLERQGRTVLAFANPLAQEATPVAA